MGFNSGFKGLNGSYDVMALCAVYFSDSHALHIWRVLLGPRSRRTNYPEKQVFGAKNRDAARSRKQKNGVKSCPTRWWMKCSLSVSPHESSPSFPISMLLKRYNLSHKVQPKWGAGGYSLIAMKINIHILFPFVVWKEMCCQRWQFRKFLLLSNADIAFWDWNEDKK